MGIPVFPPRFDTDLLKPFYEGLEKGELRMSACSTCGEFHWYPPEILHCHPEAKIDWRTISPEGVIYSFTTVTRSLLPGDHRDEVPFTVILVESDDVPNARIPSIFMAREGQEAECGMRVRLSPVQAGEHILPAFEAID
ncbi:MAG: OB-fold domain-containing protein [Emcibacter sp.]|nr:OB-fold domain-containing protein [Emcibacter sp.]